MDQMTIANTIASQMGGAGRIAMMLGKRPMATTEKDMHGLVVRWPSRQASRGNCMTVLLDEGSDTYEVRFDYVSVKGVKAIASHTDVYCDDLVRLFEEQSGWVL